MGDMGVEERFTERERELLSRWYGISLSPQTNGSIYCPSCGAWLSYKNPQNEECEAIQLKKAFARHNEQDEDTHVSPCDIATSAMRGISQGLIPARLALKRGGKNITGESLRSANKRFPEAGVVELPTRPRSTIIPYGRDIDGKLIGGGRLETIGELWVKASWVSK